MALAARLGALRAVLMARGAGDAPGESLHEQLSSERWPLEVTAQARITLRGLSGNEATADTLLARYQLARRGEAREAAHDRSHVALARHAGDPVAPSGQLHALMNEVASWNLMHPDQADELSWLESTLLRNPSLPLDVLEQVLQLPPGHPWPLNAWHNPAVALLLVRSPLPVLEAAAQKLLAHLCGAPSTATLEQLVASCQPLDAGSPPGREQVGTMARRLADVFGLPFASS